MSQKRIQQIEQRIDRIKKTLMEIGPMRPGSLTRQYKDLVSRFDAIPFAHEYGVWCRNTNFHFRVVAARSRQTTTLTMPSSSSRVTKVTPLAVSGRWRSVTSPARRTGVPCGSSSSDRPCDRPPVRKRALN